MLAGHVLGPIRGHPAIYSHWRGQASLGRADHCDPLSLGGHGDDEVGVVTFKPDFHSLRPLPGTPKMLGETTPTGSQGIPSTVGGRGVVERAGLEDQHGGIYPGSGRK